MNKIINSLDEISDKVPKKGDLYMSDDNIPHVIGYFNGNGNTSGAFVAISLVDGNRWQEPNEDICVAVSNLKRIGPVKIIIDNIKDE